jgi:hypothetical protein
MFSYENDLVVGCVSHWRKSRMAIMFLGCFLNTTPVRLKISCSPLSDTRVYGERDAGSKQHERLPLFEIALSSGKSRTNPLFDTLFNFPDFHIYRELEMDEATDGARKYLRVIEGQLDTNTLFDFEVDITSGNLFIHPKYNVQVISDEMVKKCCVYFVNILENI